MRVSPFAYLEQTDLAPAVQHIYLCGYNFYKWDGVRLGSNNGGAIAKIQLDGTLVETFSVAATLGGTTEVRFMTVLNNHIYADYRNSSVRTIKKLDLDGNILLTIPTLASGGSVWNMQAQEGKSFFTVTGNNNLEWDGTTLKGVAKINEDLTPDTTFQTNIGSGVSFAYDAYTTITKIGVGTASNNNFNNKPLSAFFTVLNLDGTNDSTFQPIRTVNGGVRTVIYIGGKWIIGGDFTQYGEFSRNRIMSYNDNGSDNTTFTNGIGTGFNGRVLKITKVTDTTIMVSGEFTSYNGTSCNKAVILNLDGTIASNFVQGTGFNGVPTLSAIGTEYYFANNLSSYNGTPVSNFTPLQSNGNLSTTFIYGDGMQTISNGVAEAGSLVLY